MQKKPSAINIIWLYLILLSIVVAAYTGKMEATTKASFDAAKGAVTLAIGLVGAMALWLGIMKVAEAGGLTHIISQAIRPVMRRLFPDVPPDHPAMPAMIMNIAANMLGLGNAATPMGIKAMAELDKLNPAKGTATDAMCLFLAINTSNVSVLPLGVIAVRAAAGASEPGEILIPTFFATSCSTVVAIIAAKFFAWRSANVRSMQPVSASPALATSYSTAEVSTAAKPLACKDSSANPAPPSDASPAASRIEGEKTEKTAFEESFKPGLFGKTLAAIIIIAFFAAIPYHFITVGRLPVFDYTLLIKGSAWFIPFLIGFFLLFGYFRGVKVYEALTDGAKEGFNVAVRIIPFLVAIFVAIGMFRESGALGLFSRLVEPFTSLIGFPVEALSVAFLRPLSGTGSFAAMTEVINHAPDSFASFLVSVLQGSTETTFYVLAVYFGSVGVRKTRYALTVGLIADAAGIVAALAISHLLFNA